MAPEATHEAPYDLFTHKHRFAAWAAARAVQRGFEGAKHKRLIELLDKIAMPWLITQKATLTQDDFDREHHALCKELCAEFPGMSYGRAAKLLAVYLKTMVVVGGEAENLADVIHPPIDGRLLKSSGLRDCLGKPANKGLHAISWTTLDCKDYFSLISRLRKALKDNEPFWMLERYWHPSEPT